MLAWRFIAASAAEIELKLMRAERLNSPVCTSTRDPDSAKKKKYAKRAACLKTS
jgi:hypothetical protein